MTNKQLAFETTANTIIKNLAARNMEGYFFETSEAVIPAVSRYSLSLKSWAINCSLL